MQLVKHGRTTSDPWQRIDDDARLPAGTGVIVSLARWCEAATSLSNHDARIGVALGPEADIDTLGPTLRGVDLVVLEFPAFVDGRHYSNAVRLRSFYAFTGEIRADAGGAASVATSGRRSLSTRNKAARHYPASIFSRC